MNEKHLLKGAELDSGVYRVVCQAREPIKPDGIIGKLSVKNTVQPHEVARSIWRLADNGKVTVRAGQGVSPVTPSSAKTRR